MEIFSIVSTAIKGDASETVSKINQNRILPVDNFSKKRRMNYGISR